MKKLLILSVCLAVLSLSTLAFAADVFVTANGKKYHTADCRFIKNKEAKAMSEEEAIASGYEPCGRCLKEKAKTSKGSSQKDVKLSQKTKDQK